MAYTIDMTASTIGTRAFPGLTIMARERDLVLAFGQPKLLPAGEKIGREWILVSDDPNLGTVSLYCWKESGKALGEWFIAASHEEAAKDAHAWIMDSVNRTASERVAMEKEVARLRSQAWRDARKAEKALS